MFAHVDAPIDHKNYLHRSHHTARAGAAGEVAVLTTTKQQTSVKGLPSRTSVTSKFFGVKPNNAELMTITGAKNQAAFLIWLRLLNLVDLLEVVENDLDLLRVSVIEELGRYNFLLRHIIEDAKNLVTF